MLYKLRCALMLRAGVNCTELLYVNLLQAELSKIPLKFRVSFCDLVHIRQYASSIHANIDVLLRLHTDVAISHTAWHHVGSCLHACTYAHPGSCCLCMMHLPEQQRTVLSHSG